MPAPSPDEIEARRWLSEVYQGDNVRQLSVRAIVSGMCIGAVMSISNLYVGLKVGWGLGVTITACIIAYGVFKSLEAVVPSYRDDPFTILENNTMSSVASAAGYMATSGLVTAFLVLYFTTGRILEPIPMMLWLGALSVLGVFMAVPTKRQLINIDKLPFPTGLATAETLKSMHSSGVEAGDKARSLTWGAIIGAVTAFWRDGFPPLIQWIFPSGLGARLSTFAIPETFPFFPGGGFLLERYTLGFEGSFIMAAAGAIMGIRVGVSLLLGAIVYFGILGPRLIAQGIAHPGYRGLVEWTLWPATSLMVASSLLSFAFRWRTFARALRGLVDALTKRKAGDDPLSSIEVPGSWFFWGTLVSGAACVYLGNRFFGISYLNGTIAVLMTFLLSLVAGRATGETDITPIGALGKITQLLYGFLIPSNMTANLMTASITSGAAAHSADLLTDLKSGYLLGGNPRKQTIAQLFGVLSGTLISVPVYVLIVDPKTLGSQSMPAPAAKVWAGVAKMLANGIGALPPGALTAIFVGAGIGILLTLGEELLPPRYRRFLPSATALGIAGVVPAFNCVSMFLGALAAWCLARRRPDLGEKYTIPVSSGIIAGESLMGVAVILGMNGTEMIRGILSKLFH